MAQSLAIAKLGNQKKELLLRDVANGIEHLIANIKRLDSSARRLSQAGDEASAALLGSFADEEAAKVLILVDAVRCPATEAKARTRTLKRWNKHLWKGIYARSCDWRPSNFCELASYIDKDLQPFYLDGPMGVDWIFPNEILDQRERQIYVDLIEGITETEPTRQSAYWAAPIDFSSESFSYQTSTCVEVALSLHDFGISTERGLNHVVRIWQPIVPSSMKPSELFAKVQETILAVRSEQGEYMVSDESICSLTPLINWPYPLWPINEPEITSNSTSLASLRKEREAKLKRIRHIQGLKNPPPAISRQKVVEMHEAFVLVEEERKRRIDSHSAGKSRPKFTPLELLDVSDTPVWLKLQKLWRALSDSERVSLVALSWFTRGTIANWPASFEQAQQTGDIHSAQLEAYCLGLGVRWLDGYRRWEEPPRHVPIGSD